MDSCRCHLLSFLYLFLWYVCGVFGFFNLSLITTANVNDDAVLSCPMDENISIDKRMWKSGEDIIFAGKYPINSGSSQIATELNYSLIFPNVSPFNEGHYVCLDVESRMNVEHLLVVHGKFDR